MKKSIVELIENKFKQDIWDIDFKIRENKRTINQLAEEQKKLKNTRKGLFEILRMIR